MSGTAIALAALVICVVHGLVGAALLSGDDRAGTGFFLGLFLGPLGVIVAALLRIDGSVRALGARAMSEPR